jgi:hypothetical protein
MENREYLLSLYEIYINLLTNKEKQYFEDYYYEDYSLQEIADNNEVSKAYVGKYINGIESKLKSFEESLKLLEKKNTIKEIIKDLDEEVKNKIIELL